MDEQSGFFGVGTAEGAVLFFGEETLGGVDPGEGGVEGRDEAVGHLWGGSEVVVVEPAGRELHDVLVHAILRGEEGEAEGFGAGDFLHEREAEATAGGFGAFDGGGQLAVVAAEDDAVGFEDGGPTGRFEGLGGFVDEEGGKAAAVEDAVGRADEGGGDDASLVEEVLLDAEFEFGGAVAEFGQAGGLFARAVAVVRGLVEGAADVPEFGVVRVGSETAFVAAIKHVGADTHGVADAQDGDSAEGELFANPVDSGVAGGADEDLCFSLEGFDDGFDEGGGFAGAGRTVDDGHFLSFDDALDGLPWKGEGRETAEGGGEGADEGFAEVDEFGVGAADGVVESVEHDSIAGGVDTGLDAEEPDLGGGADGLEGGVVGYGKGEGARGDLLDVELEGEFVEGHVVVAVEEGDGFAGFEFCVGFVVGEREGDGEGELVEGVVGGVAKGDGVAAGGLLNLCGEVAGEECAGVGFLLILHLDFKKLDLLLKC